MEVFPETFDVREIMEEVANTARPLMDNHANQLQVDCPASIGTMHSDLTKIRQMLLNLLSNASKFTEQGTITLSVERDGRGQGETVTFRVHDTGIGMTPQQMARVFQAFTQADTSTTSKFGGTGLGLTITRKFCEILGGDIHAASEPDVGSTFTIKLPARLETPAAPTSSG